MTSPDLTTRARRTVGAPWAAMVAAVALLGGCATPPPAAAPEPDRFATAFVTDNGLLGVPELWQSVERSTTAALLRHLAEVAAGRASTWALSPRATYAALREESDPVEAAGLIVDAGLDASGLWGEGDVRAWWAAALADGDIDHQAVIVRLTAHPERLPASAAAVQSWRTALHAPDAVPARLAADLLAIFAPAEGAKPTGTGAINFRAPRDAATYLRQLAVTGHRSPDAQNPEILTIARTAVATDDWAMYHLASAYAVAGQPQAAGAVVDAMDPRRLLPDGSVLEVPLFEGTVGSTFRLVRTLAAQGRLGLIRPELKASLLERTRSLLDTDVSHRVAGLALINLLEPGNVPASQATAAVAAALSAAGVSGVLRSPRQAIGWTTVAEYADALGVPLDYPGITAAAVRTWVTVRDPLVTVSLSRFLLAVPRSSDAVVGSSADDLVTRIRAGLAKPGGTRSIGLFSGALAVHRATGKWPVDVQQLRDQVAGRDGGCLGGFDGFVRDLSDAGTACDTDATWFATLLTRELDR